MEQRFLNYFQARSDEQLVPVLRQLAEQNPRVLIKILLFMLIYLSVYRDSFERIIGLVIGFEEPFIESANRMAQISPVYVTMLRYIVNRMRGIPDHARLQRIEEEGLMMYMVREGDLEGLEVALCGGNDWDMVMKLLVYAHRMNRQEEFEVIIESINDSDAFLEYLDTFSVGLGYQRIFRMIRRILSREPSPRKSFKSPRTCSVCMEDKHVFFSCVQCNKGSDPAITCEECYLELWEYKSECPNCREPFW